MGLVYEASDRMISKSRSDKCYGGAGQINITLGALCKIFAFDSKGDGVIERF